MKEKPKNSSLEFMDRGRFIRFDYNMIDVNKRGGKDRRESLNGKVADSVDGVERRVGARRLEDVKISIRVLDKKQMYASNDVFQEIMDKVFNKEILPLVGNVEENYLNISFGETEVYIETKLKYRDRIKQVLKQKGLESEVVDNGTYIGNEKRLIKEVDVAGSEKEKAVLEVSKLMKGLSEDDILADNEATIFKVFSKCLNEVHPISGDHQHDALKQDVSLEQRIIFISKKHYPKTEKYTYSTIINQVMDEIIKKYNGLISLEAEKSNLEDKFRVTSDQSVKGLIERKENEIQVIKDSTLDDTIKTLYLYLDFFKDIMQVGIEKTKIENVYKKVNDKKIEVMKFEEFQEIIEYIQVTEKEIKKKRPKNLPELTGYLNWLKNEISNEIYFVRFLWIHNLRGRKYIMDGKESIINIVSSSVG